MDLKILDSRRIIYHGQARSVFVQADTGEFEILDFHRPLVSLLRKGVLVVDQEKVFAVNKGVINVSANQVIALVEETL